MAQYSRSALKDMFSGGTAATQTKFENLLDSVVMPEDTVFAGTRFAKLTAADHIHGDPTVTGDFDWIQEHTAPGGTITPSMEGLVPYWSVPIDVSNGFLEIDGATGATIQINQLGYYLFDCSIAYTDLRHDPWEFLSVELMGSSEGPTGSTGSFSTVATLDTVQTVINSNGDGSLEDGRLSGRDIIAVEDVPYYFYVKVNLRGASAISTLQAKLFVSKLSVLND